MMWRLSVVGAALFLLFVAAPVVAQDETVLIQFDVVARGDVGEVVPVGSVAVDPALVGSTFVATVRVENNKSAHPNNDFIMSSGGITVEIPDFERTPGGITSVQSRLVLGETITVSIRLGEDKVASLAGDTVAVTLVPAPTTTTTAATTTTTTTATTTTAATTTTTTSGAVSADTSTTLETPIGAVEAGGGGTAGAADAVMGSLIIAGVLSLAVAFGLAAGGRRLSRTR